MSLRVLHIIESLEPDAGSIAVSLAGLSETLSSQGMASQIVAAHDADGRATHSDSASLTSAIANADVLHVHGWGYDLARDAATAASNSGIPYVISPIGTLCEETRTGMPWSSRSRTARADRRLLGRAQAVCSMNDFESESLRARSVHENVLTLPYGLSTAEYAPGANQVDPKRDGRCLLMLGPVHPIEGTVPLLKAFSEVGKVADGWTVVVAGREEETWRQMLEAAVRRKGGEDRASFAVAPDVATQQTLLRRASLVAAPSLRVRFPLTIMQASAAGIPVLATNCSAPDELRDSIRVCNPLSHEIKMSLRKLLLLSDDERREMGSRASDVMTGQLDWSIRAVDFATLYTRTVESKSATATL